VLDLIIGQYAEQPTQIKPFMTKVVDAFLNTLVQFLSDSTRDIKDFIRVGRSLWPLYIEPLHPNQIEATMEIVRKKSGASALPNASLDKEILEHLGQKFHIRVGKVSGDLTRLSIDSPIVISSESTISLPKRPARQSDIDQPFLRSCLLLAAFVCQNNRPDQDKKVFSVHGNGRRKKREHSNNAEDGAFSSSAGHLDQLRSLRPRPFLVERVFSIFVTLVRLNPDGSRQFTGSKNEEFSPESLGSTRLYRDLAQLVDLGHLHPATFAASLRGEQVNLNGAKFWCSLTKEEAVHIAKKIGVPLESYLV
jgi:hypothetical protein